MRTRAGIILIQNNRVALIERHRAGMDYFVFPGGGVDIDESPEQAAVREVREELGIEVTITQKVAEIQFDQSTQIYYLVDWIGGEFGSGTGEEYTNADPNNPQEGIYIPIWMPLEELPQHRNIYPVDVARLSAASLKRGWPKAPILVVERPT